MVFKTRDEIINLNDNGTFLAEQISTKQKISGNFYKSVLGKNIFAINYTTEDKEFIAYYNFNQKKFFGSIFSYSKNYGDILE